MLLTIVWLTFHLMYATYGHVCFHCVSYAHFLSPTLRRQLGAQSDVFHWPADASSPNCGQPMKSLNHDTKLQAQFCTKHNLCVTLSPNVANVSFVVRGCLEQVLVTRLRIHNELLKDGCYIVKSKPIYKGEESLDYVICVCSSDYCNDDPQSAYIDLETSILDYDKVVELTDKEETDSGTKDISRSDSRRLMLKTSNGSPLLSIPLSLILSLSLIRVVSFLFNLSFAGCSTFYFDDCRS